MSETLRAEVMAVRFSGDDFAVLAAVTDEGEEVTLTGPLAHVHEGEVLECRGGWRDHPRHGRQFAVERVRSEPPASEDALLAYLASVKHVGPQGAAWLLERHGAGVLDEVDRDPAGRLGEVPGIGARRLRAAVASWERRAGERAIRLFLDEHGVPAAAASRLVRALGPGAVERLRTDPYGATDVEGIGFATADALARALGVPADDPARLDAGLLHALREAGDDGHCFLPRDELERRAARLLGLPENAVRGRIGALGAAGRLVLDGGRIVDPAVDAVECRLARRIADLLGAPPVLEPAKERPDGPLSADQWRAIEQALGHRLSILTGGPGTGKCLREDVDVVVNGRLLPIGEAWRLFAGQVERDGEGEWATPTEQLRVPALGADGRMKLARVRRLYRQRVDEPGRRVVLSDGSEAVMTARHRVLGPDGWHADPRPGELVCVPSRLPHPRRDVDPELAELLAWQIAEGHERQGGALVITQKDVSRLERLRDVAWSVGVRYGLRMGRMAIRTPAGRAASLQIDSVAYRSFLQSAGYEWGHRSRDKRVPDFLMCAGRSTSTVVLRALFGAEGSVQPGYAAIEVSSASRTLIRQVNVLLRRHAIWMRIRRVRKCATNGQRVMRDYWVGTISGPSLRTFATKIGFADPGKESRLFAEAIKPSNANVDTVAINDLLVAAKKATGLSRHFFGLTSSYFSDGKQPSRTVALRTLRHLEALANGRAAVAYEKRIAALTGRAGHRYKGRNLAAFDQLDKHALEQICSAVRERIQRQVKYVSVRSVEPVALKGWVYDFEVPEHHNYVAGGMLTHNTASMRALVDVVLAQRRRVRLCAPTGKAARRLAESSGREATTIHRLLEWSGEEGGFTRDEDDPIPGADLLVVDEASMLSLSLADALFRAVGPRTHVLLVGDADQLPPVGAGRVLDDLLESGEVPAVRLTEVFRQARRSLIVRAAHAVNAGLAPPTRPESDDDVRDFFLVGRETSAELFAEAVSLAAERLPAHYGLDPAAGVQVLSPMHRGAAGIDALNAELRARLNPDGRQVPGTALRVGDRVVQTVNDHERDLMNGETGVIAALAGPEPDAGDDRGRARVVLVTDDGRRVTLPVAALATIRQAYAMSVHKAQGSSAPAVVVVLDASHRVMLTRNLLYTAITRSERVCVLVAHPAALEVALRTEQGRARHTRLAELVAAA